MLRGYSHETKVALTVFKARVDVSINKVFFKELNRCTRKNPPPHLKYSLIYVSCPTPVERVLIYSTRLGKMNMIGAA